MKLYLCAESKKPIHLFVHPGVLPIEYRDDDEGGEGLDETGNIFVRESKHTVCARHITPAPPYALCLNTFLLGVSIVHVKVQDASPPLAAASSSSAHISQLKQRGARQKIDTEIALNIGKEIARDILYLFLFLVLFSSLFLFSLSFLPSKHNSRNVGVLYKKYKMA